MLNHRFCLAGFLQNRAIWLVAFAITISVSVAPALAQEPPGAAAAAAGAAVAASASAPASPAYKRAQSAAAEGAQVGDNALTSPESNAAPPATTEVAANGTTSPEGAEKQNKVAPGPPLTGVAAQCADLLKLATDLKTEVDKTTKDELSVSVVRDAGQIEELAKKMREGQR